MKKLLKTVIVLILIAALLLSPPLRQVWSMAVMGVYSAQHANESVLKDEGVAIEMPGDALFKENGWYPFVMTFNADRDFSRYIDKDVRLTIMYNFAAFNLLNGASELYNENSPLYSSFYGAYAVKQADGTPYGFNIKNGELTLDEELTAEIPKYDYHRLVLKDFGLTEENAVFDWSITEREDAVSLAGYDDWFRIDADLTVNGCNHNYNGFVQSYLQYGIPVDKTKNPLAPVGMQGRVYARYFEEQGLSIFIYVLTADEQALNACDEQLLSQTKIICS